MTWKEWKQWMEQKGVKDDDEIDYIDCSEPGDADRLEQEVYSDGTRWNDGKPPVGTKIAWAIW